MPTIVTLTATANFGKTSTICAFAHHLLVQYPNHVLHPPTPSIIPVDDDFSAIVEIYPKTIVIIASEGDPTTDLEARLLGLISQAPYPPALILCASRTKGDTVHAPNRVAAQYGYEVIRTAPYTIRTVPNARQRRSTLHDLKAQHILLMVQAFSII